MIFDEECLLIVAQNVSVSRVLVLQDVYCGTKYVGVSGTTGRVLLFLPVSSQGYQSSTQIE